MRLADSLRCDGPGAFASAEPVLHLVKCPFQVGLAVPLGEVSTVEGIPASDNLVSRVLKEAVAFVQHLVLFFWPNEYVAALLKSIQSSSLSLW